MVQDSLSQFRVTTNTKKKALLPRLFHCLNIVGINKKASN
jgi:hypothetical protein